MTKKPESQLSKWVGRKRSYLIGVLLGLSMLIFNTIVGLYVVNLVLDSENPPEDLKIVPPPVTQINEKAYSEFKLDYLDRQKKDFIEPPTENPFNSD